jgi:hypothetical protein
MRKGNLNKSFWKPSPGGEKTKTIKVTGCFGAARLTRADLVLSINRTRFESFETTRSILPVWLEQIESREWFGLDRRGGMDRFTEPEWLSWIDFLGDSDNSIPSAVFLSMHGATSLAVRRLEHSHWDESRGRGRSSFSLKARK